MSVLLFWLISSMVEGAAGLIGVALIWRKRETAGLVFLIGMLLSRALYDVGFAILIGLSSWLRLASSDGLSLSLLVVWVGLTLLSVAGVLAFPLYVAGFIDERWIRWLAARRWTDRRKLPGKEP